MIAKILGTIWILLGILWVIRPQMLRRRLLKKMNRRMRWAVYGFIFVFVFSLTGIVIKAQGLLFKIAGLIGIFLAARYVLSITSKASEKIARLGSEKSLLFFRIWGIVVFVSGILLILA